MRDNDVGAARLKRLFQPTNASRIAGRPRMIVVVTGIQVDQPPAVDIDEVFVSGTTLLRRIYWLFR